MMSAMNKPTQQPDHAPLSARAAEQLKTWEALRDQMQTLHAELEYLRLMLKLSATKP
jgi:hypothetical protein